MRGSLLQHLWQPFAIRYLTTCLPVCMCECVRDFPLQDELSPEGTAFLLLLSVLILQLFPERDRSREAVEVRCALGPIVTTCSLPNLSGSQ